VSASNTSYVTMGGGSIPNTHGIGGFMCHKASLDALEKLKICSLPWTEPWLYTSHVRW